MKQPGWNELMRRSLRIALTIQVLLLALGSAAQAQRWSDVRPMPTARYAAGAVGLDGKLYVLGGGSAANGSNWGPYTHALEAYDALRNRWTEGAPLGPGQLWDPVVETVGDKIYLLGGFPNQVGIWEYDPATDAWNRKSNDVSFGGGLWGSNAVSGVVDGKILVANVEWGGVYAYDPETNRRTEIDPRGYFRLRSQGGVIDGKM